MLGMTDSLFTDTVVMRHHEKLFIKSLLDASVKSSRMSKLNISK